MFYDYNSLFFFDRELEIPQTTGPQENMTNTTLARTIAYNFLRYTLFKD